jgi:type VI protein secretion system component Hcp
MLVVVPTVAVVSTGFGTALAGASIPSTNGTITGCYPTIGSLKVLSLIDTSAGATCPPGFAQITFNQTGPQGPVGAAGAAGKAGATGAQGPAGPPGATGPQGLAGTTGAQGPAGPPGATGAQGPAGATGAQGPAGPAGSASTPPSPTANVVGTVTFDFSADNSDMSNIYSFDETANQSTNIGSQSTGDGAGKVTFSDVTITKASDASSIDLFNALAKGAAFDSAEVVLYEPGTTTPTLSYQFNEVLISSDEISVDSTNNTPLEKVTFAVASIAETFGAGQAAPISGGWNQLTNSQEPTFP